MVDNSRPDGFTLPEVIVVVVIIGLLATVLAAVFSVIVRTQPTAEARVDDARSLLGVTTWFPGDVNSTPIEPSASSPSWNIDPSAASGCSGAPTGTTNLIRLRWEEMSGGTALFEASYVLANVGGWRIQRVYCEDGGPAELISLTSELGDPSTTPVVVTLRYQVIDVGGLPISHVVGATMVISTIEGDTLTVDSVSESPSETLPTIPTGSTTSSSTTTSTVAVANPPVAGDLAVNLSLSGSAFTITLPASDPDGTTPTFVSHDSTDPRISIAPITGTLDLQLTALSGADGETFNFQYVVTDGTATAQGTITITLVAGPSGTTTTTSTTTTSTTVPCAVTGLTAAPSPVQNQPKNNGTNDPESRLTQPVVVTVSGLSGDCSGLQLRWSLWTDPYPLTKQQAELFSGSTTITFEALATERWQDGNHTLTLFDTLQDTLIGPTFTLVVT